MKFPVKKDVITILAGLLFFCSCVVAPFIYDEYFPLLKYKKGMNKSEIVMIYSSHGLNKLYEFNGPMKKIELRREGRQLPKRHLKDDESLLVIAEQRYIISYLYFDKNGILIYKDSCPQRS